MRYPASEKLEIIRTVEASHLPVKQTLKMIGIFSSTYYDWCARWSDNGASYVAADLAEYLDVKGMDHVRGAPHHPQTQGKIERWHQAMKNRVLLEKHFLPGELERQISTFVDHYNNHRYHESLANLTPVDVYHGRGAKILKMREEIKKQTFRKRR
jgi:transposase InsO family protein